MSTNAITSDLAGYVQKVTSGAAAPSSAMQEATETAAVTAKEAARGDRQAIAKIARQKQQAQQEEAAKEPGKGEAVDHSA
jgi:hypothetical protein